LESTVTTPVWGQPYHLSHWLKHATLPVLLLLGLLALPYPWLHPERLTAPLITVELQPAEESVEPLPEPEPTEPIQPPEPMLPEPVEPLPATAAPPPPVAQSEPSEPVAAEPTQAPEAADPVPSETSSVSAGDIMLMASSRTSIEITEEFTARSPTAKNFYIPEQEIQNWLDDIPFLDESVDRPTVEMRFYAEGLEGHIEKFFDKITISKTFTTKYGTKIHCALIGVIAACSWK
jgi:hypothetical protein